MIYQNTGELIELLKRENLWAKKKLGQNFLINPEALKNIVKAAEIQPGDNIVEIGPGLGILTEQLSQNAKTVTSIELDQTIIPVLKRNLAKATNSPDPDQQSLDGQIHNIHIIHQDALQYDPPSKPYKLVANIPYYITSPILNHFLEKQPTDKRPQLLILLVQKEVAQKICVKTGDQTILSLEVQAFGKPSIVCNVGKNSFYPQPNVDSAVLKIETYPEPKITDPEIFFKIIKGAFNQKRKKISNTIPPALNLNTVQTNQLFQTSNVPSDMRPQNISLEQWEALIQAYKKLMN
jgi:16S rRNA (adenine1518-N6/adenine1519-N6)-dimethyltransferase